MPSSGGGAGAPSLRDGGPGGNRTADAGRRDGSADGGDGGASGGDGNRPDASAPPVSEYVDAQPPTFDATPADCTKVRSLSVSDDACTALAEARCLRRDVCAPFLVRSGAGATADCIDQEKARCERTLGLPGQSAIVLEAAHRCAEVLINAPCRCVDDEVCPELLPSRGTLPDGAGCRTDDQCAGGACHGATPLACGACAPGVPRAKRCNAAFTCAAGLVCGASGACVEPRRRGEGCLGTEDCLAGLACIGRRCGAQLPLGSSCDESAADCDSRLGLVCVDSACVESTVGAHGPDGGTACGGERRAFVVCDGDSYCDGAACAPRGGVGAPCSTRVGSVVTCAASLACDPATERCVTVPALSCP